MNDLVSIIIPCYNASSFLKDAVQSVLDQTYMHWELILINDHSTDDTANVIQECVQLNPEKIRDGMTSGKGACAARNTGLAMAKGKFIQFLDADDLIHPRKLEMQLSAFTENTDVVYSDLRFFQSAFIYGGTENFVFGKSHLQNFLCEIDWRLQRGIERCARLGFSYPSGAFWSSFSLYTGRIFYHPKNRGFGIFQLDKSIRNRLFAFAEAQGRYSISCNVFAGNWRLFGFCVLPHPYSFRAAGSTSILEEGTAFLVRGSSFFFDFQLQKGDFFRPWLARPRMAGAL
jgi:cellulose synthase/poly-beta-1,6-N-acetylglucosamine synthase-like glycosyltransferase